MNVFTQCTNSLLYFPQETAKVCIERPLNYIYAPRALNSVLKGRPCQNSQLFLFFVWPGQSDSQNIHQVPHDHARKFTAERELQKYKWTTIQFQYLQKSSRDEENAPYFKREYNSKLGEKKLGSILDIFHTHGFDNPAFCNLGSAQLNLIRWTRS